MYLLPKPLRIQPEEGCFCITYNCKIVVDSSEGLGTRYAFFLQDELEKMLGYRLMVTRGKAEGKAITLIKNVTDFPEDLQRQEGSYQLVIGEAGIKISAASDAGIFYGVQTLRQIVCQEGAVISGLKIEDWPSISNRGFYHDVTRGRIPTLSFLKKLADKMAFYKLNQLQLYIEHSFLFEQLSELWRDDTPITPEEILELDEYCHNLHIELVPSLSTFGHLYKLLGTKTWNHLCELDGWQDKEFSFRDRMHHHTIDASNPESIKLVKEMIGEFLPLFRSKHFNICADETFDLGHGKSKEMAERIGSEKLYINYVKELCQFVLEQAKRPMFWGDVICSFPEAVKELPKGTICLNWGYSPYESEENTKKLYDVGVPQYSCPGVSGWNCFVNRTKDSYENISRMASYAHKYHSIGLLNTDWGDYGHINHPDFSIPGMIYGAAFSWNPEILPFAEINRQISKVEFRDHSERFMEIVAEVANHTSYDWPLAVLFLEARRSGLPMEINEESYPEFYSGATEEKNRALGGIIQAFYDLVPFVEPQERVQIKSYIIAVEGIMLFNRIGDVVGRREYALDRQVELETALAEELEHWFYGYKEMWRSVSRESELYRVQNVMNEYADYLREVK